MEGMDSVLAAHPPRLDGATAARIAADRFGVRADGADDVGSERDQTFILTDDGRPTAVLKVSNSAEKVATLDMEALVVRRDGATVTEAELIDHVKGRVARYKAPSSIEFRDTLARTATGKLQKFKLRAPYWEGRERAVN